MGRLVSCSSCGKIHEATYICDKKKANMKRNRDRYKEKLKGTKDIRSTGRWKRKANDIKVRDLGLCQMCKHNMDMLSDMRLFNAINVQVHHIIKIKDNPDLAFEDSNLITLCRYHHDLVEDKPKYIKVLQGLISPPTY